MPLQEEIQAARKKVVADGYEMSLGELINLYRNDELKIDPVFQRLFRWDDERKTRFIESIILGIPFPPIFVYQDDKRDRRRRLCRACGGARPAARGSRGRPDRPAQPPHIS